MAIISSWTSVSVGIATSVVCYSSNLVWFGITDWVYPAYFHSFNGFITLYRCVALSRIGTWIGFSYHWFIRNVNNWSRQLYLG